MTKIDLNIVDRGTPGSNWNAEGFCLSPKHLDQVIEQKTDSSTALNSLPTPFARFFVAREAFRRTTEERDNKQIEAGFAYKQLVSSILDIYELLFNLKYHNNSFKNSGQKLEIREWDSATNLSRLEGRMPILHNAIVEYYTDDINEGTLHFLVYTENGRDLLLACSSPMTGFVTPPDLDRIQRKRNGITETTFAGDHYRDLHLRRKSGGEYFRDIRMFDERDPDFKNYMYKLFESDNVDSKFRAIKEYVRSFQHDEDIHNDYDQKLENVKTDQNNDLTINGLTIQSCDEADINNYFTPSIIKVPYRIERKRFKAVRYRNDDDPNRQYDYLLPFRPEIMNLLDGNDIDSDISIKKDSVAVRLRYHGREYTKEYATDPLHNGIGRIIDLNAAHINFNLGVFPNILSQRQEENNYFKIIVVAADEDADAHSFNIDQISLSFFKRESDNTYHEIQENDPDTPGVHSGRLPAVVRSQQKSKAVNDGTLFYELFDTAFDVVEVAIQGATGLIMPCWKESQVTPSAFTYAIDLGTSNTFMSRCRRGDNNRPELLRMDSPMIDYLHEIPDNRQRALSLRIEDSFFESAKRHIKTEFLPAIIDSEVYKFPIRTALCGKRNSMGVPALFDSHNIAFFYEKLMAGEDQTIHTDIKWNEEEKPLLRVFIRELLLIIKCDILQHNGDLSQTRIIWFRPLSFMGRTRNAYEEIWSSESRRILGINTDQIDCFSESEAPYYYFKRRDYIRDSDAVSVIDIGGGSTDFVYFRDNQPVMANSVHFGCDILWGNGFIQFENERANGIYRRYADKIHFKRDELEDMNTDFINVAQTTTKDIISFWLNNADACDIRNNLSTDFKPVFVYHLVSILYYMASMYKDYGHEAPKTVVFSGNGSRYIDNFICSDQRILTKVINMVFETVFGGTHNVNLKLPEERKESTCYGGLYRDPDAAGAAEKIYQGDVSADYETVGAINAHYETLTESLLKKYNELNNLYENALTLLKKENIIDHDANTKDYVEKAREDMETPLRNYYKSQVREKYQDEVPYKDSVFFLPIIDRIFNMTNL